MIKYFGTNTRNLIKFDKRSEQCNLIPNTRSCVDFVWVIEEDGELDGKEVNVGDIVFRMYPIELNSDYEYIIVKDKPLKDFYNRLLNFSRMANLKEPSFSSIADGCEQIKEN